MLADVWQRGRRRSQRQPTKRQMELSHEPANHLEAGAGIEPAYEGFADPCLTTWLPRLARQLRSR